MAHQEKMAKGKRHCEQDDESPKRRMSGVVLPKRLKYENSEDKVEVAHNSRRNKSESPQRESNHWNKLNLSHDGSNVIVPVVSPSRKHVSKNSDENNKTHDQEEQDSSEDVFRSCVFRPPTSPFELPIVNKIIFLTLLESFILV